MSARDAAEGAAKGARTLCDLIGAQKHGTADLSAFGQYVCTVGDVLDALLASPAGLPPHSLPLVQHINTVLSRAAARVRAYSVRSRLPEAVDGASEKVRLSTLCMLGLRRPCSSGWSIKEVTSVLSALRYDCLQFSACLHYGCHFLGQQCRHDGTYVTSCARAV